MSFRFRSLQLVQWALYLLATVQFIRFYVVSTTFYLNMPLYLAGQERLPFQYRVLPIFFMRPINNWAFLLRHFSHPSTGWDAASASAPQTFSFYLVSLVSFIIAGGLVVRLYRAVHPDGMFAWLVYPIFMVLVLWTYVVHIDANFSYPYDMPSLAFFAGGLLAIYTRRFVPLVLIVLLGTINRETTLFLVGIYILDAATCEPLNTRSGLVSAERNPRQNRFLFAQVPWLRAGLLLALWLAVKLTLAHYFLHNSRVEEYSRIRENFHRLTPRLWPALFDICGYVLPVVILFRNRLTPLRFSNYLFILPFWLGVMFYAGVILETRIWGELCTYTAVAATLLIEEPFSRMRDQLAARGRPTEVITA